LAARTSRFACASVIWYFVEYPLNSGTLNWAPILQPWSSGKLPRPSRTDRARQRWIIPFLGQFDALLQGLFSKQQGPHIGPAVVSRLQDLLQVDIEARVGKLIGDRVIGRLRDPMAVLSPTMARRTRYPPLEVEHCVGEIDLGLGHVEFGFEADLEKGLCPVEVLAQLFNHFRETTRFALRLQESPVSLLDCKGHLRADVVEIRT